MPPKEQLREALTKLSHQDVTKTSLGLTSGSRDLPVTPNNKRSIVSPGFIAGIAGGTIGASELGRPNHNFASVVGGATAGAAGGLAGGAAGAGVGGVASVLLAELLKKKLSLPRLVQMQKGLQGLGTLIGGGSMGGATGGAVSSMLRSPSHGNQP